MIYGLVWQSGAWWVGAHWSKDERRLCITLLPMLTVFIVWPDGEVPTTKRILWISK